jgi:hypothetical protein
VTSDEDLCSRIPYLKRCVFGDVFEVDVGGQNGQLMTDAQLRQQRVDCPRLNTTRAAQIAQFCGVNVIFPVRIEERERRKALDDLPPGFGSGETLQEFLEYEASAEYGITGFNRMDERVNFRQIGRSVAAQEQRPDACVD